jgi:type II secretory pathway pseudopilin PulG
VSPRGGYALLTLLIVIALLGVGLLGAVSVWSLDRQRGREEELLFVGEQYRQAIGRYYLAAPRGGRTLPPSLDVLLDDDRYPIPVHHLRRAYPDPITGKADWGLVKVGERIIGVYSLSEAHPLKTAGFDPAYKSFEAAASYRDWIFAFRIPGRTLPVAPAPPASTPAKPTPQSPARVGAAS